MEVLNVYTVLTLKSYFCKLLSINLFISFMEQLNKFDQDFHGQIVNDIMTKGGYINFRKIKLLIKEIGRVRN